MLNEPFVIFTILVAAFNLYVLLFAKPKQKIGHKPSRRNTKPLSTPAIPCYFCHTPGCPEDCKEAEQAYKLHQKKKEEKERN